MANRMALPLLVLGALCALVLGGCRQANVPEAYVNPDFRAHIPQRVAVYVCERDTIGNMYVLTPTAALKIRQEITTALHRMNPHCIVQQQEDDDGAVEALASSYIYSNYANMHELSDLCTYRHVDGICYFGVEAIRADSEDHTFSSVRIMPFLMQKDASVLWSNDYVIYEDDLQGKATPHPERLAPALAKELLQTLPAGK